MSEERPNARQGGLSDELRPYVDRYEAEEIDRVGERLMSERPPLRTGLRSELRAQLSAKMPTPERWRPKRLGLLIASFVGSGFVLLTLAALGLADAGPLS